jgi:TetR/AcrR family transcriptional regulator
MPPSGTGHQRLPADERRRQLIETAIDLFSRKGFSGTTTKEIAAAAGVNEAIVFRHFATKKDLYTAIIEHRLGNGLEQWYQSAQALMEKKDDEGLFRLLVTEIIRAYRDNPQFERLMMFAALEGQELAVINNQMAQPVKQQLIDYIARRQRAGAIRKGDPMAIVLTAVGTAKFYGAQRYLFESCWPVSDESTIDAFIQVLMAGIRGPRANGGKK